MTNFEQKVLAQANKWGWNHPDESVLQAARIAVKAQQMQSYEIVVDLGLLTKDKYDEYISQKPANQRAINWLAQQSGNVASAQNKILSLAAGFAYYENLELLNVHECMYDKEIKKHADKLGVVVMLIEETTPVLIFSSYNTMVDYRSMGKVETSVDPIFNVFKSLVQCAVGVPDAVSSIINHVKSKDDAKADSDLANVWVAAAAGNNDKEENRTVTRLLDHALSKGATDIALMPQRNGEYLVKMRRHNEMVDPQAVGSRITAEVGAAIIQLLESKSGANPTNTQLRRPADGHISYKSTSGGDVFLRLSFIPLNHLGDMKNLKSVSIRLLPRTESKISLETLDLNPEVIKTLSFAMAMGHGLVVVMGPTNSGKSTTVAGAIGEHVKLYGERRKRISLEDPIERFISGIIQVNLHTNNQVSRGESFADVLRAFKRHDPDLIWIGEVQDGQTAEVCVSQASTGHLAITTMHAQDTIQGLDHLSKMINEGKRFQLVDTSTLFLSQRLVPALCDCKEAYQVTLEDREKYKTHLAMIGNEELELPNTAFKAKPGGCEKCNKEGISGLLPVNEVLLMTSAAKRDAAKLIQGQAGKEIMIPHRRLTLQQDLMRRLKAGQIDIASMFE